MKKKRIIIAATLCSLALLAVLLWPRREMKPVLLKGLRFSIPSDWEEAAPYSFLYRFRYGSAGDGEARFRVELLNDLKNQRYLPELSTVWGPKSAAVLAEDTPSRNLAGYTAISTETTSIKAKTAAVHRFRTPGNGGSWYDCTQYAVGTEQYCVRISIRLNADAESNARKDFETDMEAVIDSLDLKGLAGGRELAVVLQTPEPTPTASPTPSPTPTPAPTVSPSPTPTPTPTPVPSPTPEQTLSPESPPMVADEDWKEIEFQGLKFSVPEDWEGGEIENIFYMPNDKTYKAMPQYGDITLDFQISVSRYSGDGRWSEGLAKWSIDTYIDCYIGNIVTIGDYSREVLTINGQYAERLDFTEKDSRNINIHRLYETGKGRASVSIYTKYAQCDPSQQEVIEVDLDRIIESIDLSGLE